LWRKCKLHGPSLGLPRGWAFFVWAMEARGCKSPRVFFYLRSIIKPNEALRFARIYVRVNEVLAYTQPAETNPDQSTHKTIPEIRIRTQEIDSVTIQMGAIRKTTYQGVVTRTPEA